MKPWFRRWKDYPVSILLHIGWGVIAGLQPDVPGAVMMAGAFAYQFGSGWYKASKDTGLDTVGNDCMDYTLGYGVAGTIARLLGWL